MKASEGNVLFPIFLKLRNIQTVVIGGGNVGLEKVEALLKNDPEANIRVIAPQIHPLIISLAKEKLGVTIRPRKARKADLKGIDLLILATDDLLLHQQLKKEAEKRHLLTNVADTPDLCDFYLGSTVKKGDLKIGISTNGQSPTFAKRFRQLLEEILPDDTHELLANLKVYRDRLKGDFQQKVTELNRITASLVRR